MKQFKVFTFDTRGYSDNLGDTIANETYAWLTMVVDNGWTLFKNEMFTSANAKLTIVVFPYDPVGT
jgi:hypothetical protein